MPEANTPESRGDQFRASLQERYRGSRRYRALEKIAQSDEDSILTFEVAAGYTGGLRPEETQISAEIEGQTITVTNGEAAFLHDREDVAARLTALELVVGNEATTHRVALELVAIGQVAQV